MAADPAVRPSADAEKDKESADAETRASPQGAGLGEQKKSGSAGKGSEKLESSSTLAILKHWLPSIPPWIGQAAKDPDNWKVGFRVSVTLWSAFILILINDSLAVMGNAAFFSCIATLIAAPAMPLQMYLFTAGSLLAGMCLGWAWSCAAMKAALTARSQTLLASQVQRTAATVAGQSNPDQLYQVQIFSGAFLDARSTVVWGVFFAIGVFFFAWVRTRAPRLIFFSLFGTIVLDAFSSYGPLLPTENFTLMQTMVISGCFGIAIAIAATILIFPQTMSYLYSKSLAKTLDSVRELADYQTEMVQTDLTDQDAWSACLPRLAGMRAKVLGGLSDLNQKTPMLELEFSRGRLSSDDLKALAEKTKVCVFLAGGLRVFPELVAALLEIRRKEKAALGDEKPVEGTQFNLTQSMRFMTDLRQHADRLEAEKGHRLSDLMPYMREASQPLMSASHDGLETCIEWLRSVNNRRWRAVDQSSLPKHEEQLTLLRKALSDFRSEGRKRVLEPYRSLFEGDDHTLHIKGGVLPFSPRSLYTIFTHQSNMTAFADGVADLLELCIQLERDRSKNRFWAPKGLDRLWHVVFDKTDDPSKPVGAGNDSQEAILPPEEEDEEKQTLLGKEIGPQVDWRDPDAMPATNPVQKGFGILHRLVHWLVSPEGLFCLKYVVGSILFWLPQVFSNSAFFSYSEKALWALIMIQFGLQPYASDQIAQLLPRILGTVFGGVLGMIAWYIGSGSGDGNPYGLAAVFAVLALPLGFLRANAPLPSFALIATGGATYVLVIGYSWLDTHIVSVGNVGKGWEVWYRRSLLVIVGLTGAFILMLLPAQSGHKRVRKGAADTLGMISGLFMLLIEGWYDEEEHHKPDSRYVSLFRARHVEINVKLQMLVQATAVAHVEISPRGKWNGAAYTKLVNLEVQMLEALQQLASALEKLDDRWRRRVLLRTAMLHPSLVSEVVTVATICNRSLLWGRPVPGAIAPDLLDRLAYYTDPKRRDLEDDETSLTWEKLSDPEFQGLAKAIVACFAFLARLDDAKNVIMELCGKIDLPNLDKRLGRRGVGKS